MRGAVAAVAAVAALMTGCTSSALKDAGSATPRAGASAVTGRSGVLGYFGHRLRVAVDGAAAWVTVSKPRVAEPDVPGGPKGTRYAVRVTVIGVSGRFDVNPRVFSARDNAGDTFDADVGGVDDQIDSSSVAVGDKLRGRVAFDVPEGKRIAVVCFLSVLGDPLANWRDSRS